MYKIIQMFMIFIDILIVKIISLFHYFQLLKNSISRRVILDR